MAEKTQEPEATEETPEVAPYDLAKAKNQLYGKLAVIMGELSAIPPSKMRHVEVQTSSGGSYSYDYITEATLMEELRPRLAREGIAVLYSDEVLRHPTKEDNLTVVRVTLTFADATSGETVELSAEGYGTDRGDKGANKAKTSAVRYLLWKTFLFASDLDPETESVERSAGRGTRTDRSGMKGAKPRPATDAQKGQLNREIGELTEQGVELDGRNVHDAIFVRTPVEDMTQDQASRVIRLLRDVKATGELSLVTPEGVTPPLDEILGVVSEGSGDFPPDEGENDPGSADGYDG